MQIIIVGCGNVGETIIEQLSKEGHNISAIDIDAAKVQQTSDQFDVLGIVGNGASFTKQMEAGIEKADLLIAVTGKDELNLLCCVIAKKAGNNCNTIARVRNPVYSQEIDYIRDEMGLSMIINPELAAAMEVGRLVKFPSAIEIDSFAKGKVEILSFRIAKGNILCNGPLKDIAIKYNRDVLVCMVERGDQVIIPDGNFVIQENDIVSVVASSKNAMSFFRKIGIFTGKAKSVMIIGGGETAFYLAAYLSTMGIRVKIVEKDKRRCDELTELLPKAMVICGDGTDRTLLMEEGLKSTEAFIAWTNFDEENIMLSLFAKRVSGAKLITKVHRISYDEIIAELDIGSIMYPKHITAESIVRYVRAMQNSIGSNVETLYRLCDNRVEALEFKVNEPSKVVGVPLQELQLKSNLLICSIKHKGKIITPGGQDQISVGDTVIVVTTNTGLDDIRDILK
ncbi:MAG: Trk system potassium transporter TrkA [Roseburia sp.]|nr:Trk system potassium transporter TrkA [Roseburia sp.]MCM1277353.1 Trk system potassium transporter TrkA [Robinsoniella sp.]